MPRRRFRAEENESDFIGKTVFVSGAEVKNVIDIHTLSTATITYQLEDPATGTPLVNDEGDPVLGTMAVRRNTIEIVTP